jgi:hypothetical protein
MFVFKLYLGYVIYIIYTYFNNMCILIMHMYVYFLYNESKY